MPKPSPTRTLPGLALATQYLDRLRNDAEDLEFIARELDPDQPTLTGNDPLITPDQALDALMILRLMAGHATAGALPMLPDPGGLTLDCAPRSEDRQRLVALIERLNADLLARDAASPASAALLKELVITGQPHPDAASYELRRFNDTITSSLLRALPVIAVVCTGAGLDTRIASAAAIRITLPPVDHCRLAAILCLVFRTARAAGRRDPKIDLGAVTELQLARIFAAGTPAQARRLLRALRTGPDRSGPTLDQVHGHPEAKEEFRNLIEDLAQWKAGRLDWAEVTSSFLLFGPPGTGKTMLAQAVAGSAGLPFVQTSYSDCQRHGHQGDMLRALTTAVEAAITQAPCVFFLDEIDSFYARSGSVNGYILGVVNGLLTLLDRLNQTPGVVVIAATNHPDTVDPAVIRAGRFDRHLPVGPLGRPGIRAMLQSELGKDVLSAADCCQLADQLSGATGADLAGLIREARTQARRAAAALSAQHVRDAADRLSPRPDPGLQRRIAVHESGHMLAAHVFGLPAPSRAELRARAGFVTTERVDILTPDRISSLVRTDLGGYAAEQVVFGTACSGSGGDAASDLAQATRRVVIAELSLGFGETLTWQPATTDLRQLSAHQRARIEQQLQEALQDTIEALRARRVDLERVAEALLRERELNRDRIAELLRDVPAATPAARGQRATADQSKRRTMGETGTRHTVPPRSAAPGE